VGGGAGRNSWLTYGIVYGMVKTTIYLPEKLKRQVKRVAARSKRSEAEVIRDAIETVMRWQSAPRPKLPLTNQGLGDPTIAERVEELLGDDFDR